jgi:hypothetical protein
MENKNEKVMVNEQAKVQIGVRHVKTARGYEYDDVILTYDDISISLSALFETDRGMFKLITRDPSKVSLYRKKEVWNDRESGEQKEGDVLYATDGKRTCRVTVKKDDKSLLAEFREKIELKAE